jgi:hypothetical protein
MPLLNSESAFDYPNATLGYKVLDVEEDSSPTARVRNPEEKPLCVSSGIDVVLQIQIILGFGELKE